MSHYTALVVLPEQPTDENQLLEKALQPFHEYECTGIKDKYVVFIDKHDEVVAEWESKTQAMWQNESGKRFFGHEDKFFREPRLGENVGGGMGFGDGISWDSRDWGDGKGHRAKVQMSDEDIEAVGFTKIEVPLKETGEYSDILAYASDYHGYEVLDGRIGNWTNPNNRWDWWVIGGRWSGMLIPKDTSNAIRGKNGLMGSHYSATGYDGCAVGNLNLEAMKLSKVVHRTNQILDPLKEAGTAYVDALPVWQAYLDAKDQDFAAWEAAETGQPYHKWIDNLPDGHPVKAFARGPLEKAWGRWGANLPKTARDPLKWAEQAPPLTCWAFLQDGVWTEKGEMGWFGMSSNDRDPGEWEDEVTKRVAALPDDHWIVMVDCHI